MTLTIASSKPSIQISVSSGSSFRLLALPDDPFRIVSESTSLMLLARTSKAARIKVYKTEYLQYQAQKNIGLIYRKISTSWLKDPESCIAQINQGKAQMAVWIRSEQNRRQPHNHAANPAFIGKATPVFCSQKITPKNATVSYLSRLILSIPDEQLNDFFDQFGPEWAPTFNTCDPASVFRNSLKKLSSAEKATKIRAWLKEKGPHLEVGPRDCHKLSPYLPPEMLEITSLMTKDILHAICGEPVFLRNPKLAQALIGSPTHLQILEAELLVHVMINTLEAKDLTLISMLIVSDRCAEIVNFMKKETLKERLLELVLYTLSQDFPLCLRLLSRMSLQTFQTIVVVACSKADNPLVREFLELASKHHKLRQIKTVTVAKAVFEALNGIHLLKTIAFPVALATAIDCARSSEPSPWEILTGLTSTLSAYVLLNIRPSEAPIKTTSGQTAVAKVAVAKLKKLVK